MLLEPTPVPGKKVKALIYAVGLALLPLSSGFWNDIFNGSWNTMPLFCITLIKGKAIPVSGHGGP
jgi:hypothetical protein